MVEIKRTQVVCDTGCGAGFAKSLVAVPPYHNFRPKAMGVSYAVRLALSCSNSDLLTMQYRGEAVWVSIFRGIAALMAVTAVVAFAAYEIILSPFAETGIIREREYQMSKYDKSLTELPKNAEWAVLVVSSSYLKDDVSDILITSTEAVGI